MGEKRWREIGREGGWDREREGQRERVEEQGNETSSPPPKKKKRKKKVTKI